MSSPRTWMRPLAATLVLSGLAAWGLAAGPWSPSEAPLDTRADAVRGVVQFEPFRLQEPFPFLWRAERPQVRSGYLVVLDVDPAALAPIQGLQPVLQLGPETIQRVNHGHLDGRLVGLLPWPAGEDGWPQALPADAAPFLAPAALPEQVTARAAAEAWEAVRGLAGSPSLPEAATAGLDLADEDALLRAAAQRILDHAPGERQLAEGLLLPRLR